NGARRAEASEHPPAPGRRRGESMVRPIAVVMAVALAAGATRAARAADAAGPNAVLDKAIQALGGEEKLSKIKAVSWTAKGTITSNGTDNAFTGRLVVQGLDHRRQEFEGEFNGSTVQGVTVVVGDKAWRDFGGNHSELDKAALANEKRVTYLTLVPITI